MYHYRIERGCGGAAAYTLISNDEAVTVIGNGGYFTQHLKPEMYEYKTIFYQHAGPNLLGRAIDTALAKPKAAYKFKAEPNITYYLRLNACFADKIIE